MRLRAALTAGFAALVLAAPAQADTFTVTNGSSDVAAGCTGTTCPSLRAAIAAAEITRPADIINVPAGTININNDLVVGSDMTIVGASARTNIIDGGAKYRGLRVSAGATVSFSHFTIRNAAAGQGGSNDGGGILNTGLLTLDNVRVTDSRAVRGGGVANISAGTTPATITMVHTLIDANLSTGTGGGVANIGPAETSPIVFVTMGDSTVFGNTGSGGAGGIAAVNAGGLIALVRTTVADNTGSAGAGGLLTTVTNRTQVSGSILARNTIGTSTASNCGTIKPTNGGSNVEDNDTCALGFTGNPILDTKLSNAGGEVDVLAIGAGSPAIDRLPVATNCTAGTPDQRGLYRPQGTACDSGAYEFDVAATYTITGGPTGTISSDSAQIDFSSSDPSATPECQLTGPGQAGGFGPCYKSNAALYTNLANGTFTFSVRDSDFPGSTPATRTFTVAALDSTITGGPTGPTNDTTPTFTFTGANGAVSFQCRVDAATFASCASPFTPTAPLAQGAHTFEVRALSASGAPENTPAARSFTVDTTAPDTTITGGPNGTIASTTATFTFTSSEAGSNFQCSIDSGAFGACPLNYTGLSQGSHTFQVRAVDTAGNVDGSPASRTWTVDTIAPDTTISGGPNGSVSSTSATFTFTSTEAGSTFQCALDGAAFGACPAGYTGLSQGSHTFQVRATDAAGNVDASPASRTWTVDTVAPDTTITGGPTGTVASASATFTFTSNEAGATFQCALDGAAFAACPVSYTGLSQGSHTFQVRAVDAAGNLDSTPASRTWIVDTVLPDTTITGGPSGSVASTAATFTFTSTEAGSTFQCALDGAAFAACPANYAGLAQGSHTFQVRATDAAGNTDASPATRTWTVDTVAPDTTITGGPTGTVASASATFTFTSNEAGATFQCALDGAAFAACPVSYTGLSQGSHTFQVRAVDAAGNLDGTPPARTWTVDTVAPATTLTDGPGTSTNDNTPTFSFTSNEGGTFQCRVDTAAFAACSSPFTTVALSDGSHTFEVRGVDAAGNVDATPAAQTFTVDTTTPNTEITDGPAASTNDTTPTFTFNGTTGVTGFQCRVDGGTYGTCSSPFTTPALAAGSHTVDIRAFNAAGTFDPSPATRTFVVDLTAPNTTLTPISSPTNDTTPSFSFGSTEAGSTFQCRIDAAAFAACTTPLVAAALAEGTHTFEVRATDPAGNLDTTSATQTFVVDLTAPNTTLPPITSPTRDTTPTFTFTSEAGATFQCRVDGAAFAACTSPHTTAVLSEGTHTLDVRATDQAGNPDPTPAGQTFVIDLTAPGAPVFVTPAEGALLATSTVQLTGTAEIGATVELREGATLRGTAIASGTGAWTIVLGAVPDGEHTYRATATDVAGNTGAASERTVTVDAALPNTTIASGPPEPSNDATPTFTFIATESATYECSIDGGSFDACATPFTTPSLAQGAHELRVRAVDAAGNRDNTPAVRTFTLDLTPPPAPDVSGPDGATTETSPAFAFSATDAVATACRLDGPTGAVGEFGECASPKAFSGLAPGDYVFFVRSTDAAGNTRTTQRAFTVTVAQPATPTPTPTATPTPAPGPVDGVSVGARPVNGTVLVKQPGTKTFVPLSASLIKLGAEVDARKGTVEITRSDGGVAKFYDGIFKLSQSGGYTVLTLTEKLTGCPKAKKSSASAAAKKPKSRKLWGDGKGKFRTKGQYSAATVRGTIWLVQDACTTTLTRVKQGVVEVQDLVKKKKVLVKAPKSYTARSKKK